MGPVEMCPWACDGMLVAREINSFHEYEGWTR